MWEKVIHVEIELISPVNETIARSQVIQKDINGQNKVCALA